VGGLAVAAAQMVLEPRQSCHLQLEREYGERAGVSRGKPLGERGCGFYGRHRDWCPVARSGFTSTGTGTIRLGPVMLRLRATKEYSSINLFDEVRGQRVERRPDDCVERSAPRGSS
jgi:hypothetical protein